MDINEEREECIWRKQWPIDSKTVHLQRAANSFRLCVTLFHFSHRKWETKNWEVLESRETCHPIWSICKHVQFGFSAENFFRCGPIWKRPLIPKLQSPKKIEKCEKLFYVCFILIIFQATNLKINKDVLEPIIGQNWLR